MPEVLHLPLKELAILGIELWAGFLEPLELFPQVVQVLLECPADHDHVVQAHEA